MSEFSSPDERLELIQYLSGLPQAQFEQITFALNPAPGVIQGGQAALGKRAAALLKWAEGSTGCGIREVLNVLKSFDPNLKDILPEPAADTHWLVP